MGRRSATLSLHCAICVSLARVCSLPNKSCCRVLSSLPLPPATPAAECGSRKFVVSSEHPVVLCSPALPVPPPPWLPDIKVKEPDFEAMCHGRKAYLPPRFMSVTTALEQLLLVEAKRGEGGPWLCCVLVGFCFRICVCVHV
jgi:hypothetical protein